MGRCNPMRERLLSLDVFRGVTVALMILVNNPGSWNHLYPPLAHAAWHGCTPTDLVFPFFLFAVGNALALVMPGHRQGPAGAFWGKVLRRTLIIFALGLLLNAAPFVRWDAAGELAWRDWSQLRVMGVLQRIALAWGAAAAIVWLAGPGAAGVRRVLAVTAALLVGYWGACLAWGDAADPYSLAGWFGTAFDRALLGASHLYRGEGVPFDPEGLASTAPAIAQVLIGWWVGERLREGGVSATTVARLFVVALGLAAAAYLWQLAMPVNKKIWTSSYVLLTSALATALLAALVHRLDLDPRRDRPVAAWVRFGQVFGMNALAVFVLSGLVPRLLGLVRWADGVDAQGLPLYLSPLPWLYRTVFATTAVDPRLGSLAYAVAHLAMYWALAAWLAHRRVFIRV